jgi:uncharacterized protein (DUF433 family)
VGIPEKRVDIRYFQELLCHNHIQTTAQYLKVDVRDLKSSPRPIPPEAAPSEERAGRGKISQVMAKTLESWAKDQGYVYPHIKKVEGICAGRPCIDGTRVRVLDIVFLEKEGYKPEQMLEQYPDLNLAQVHAALTYYHDNPEEMDAYIAEDEASDEKFERDRAEFLSKRRASTSR